MGIRIILLVVAFLIWLGLTWSVDLLSLLVGGGVSALIALLIADMYAPKVYVFRRPAKYFWFIYYIPLFFWECLKANIDVAYRVAHPKVPIRPGIVKVKTTLKNETAITILANSITLTPGTLSVDVDKEQGILYVHWIVVRDERTEEATRIIIERFESILRRIFE